jgi:hypothetical protein
MTTFIRLRGVLVAVAAAATAGCATTDTVAARDAHDYPTLDRVRYVGACMRDNPGPPAYELMAKCSCAIDAIAREVPHDQFETMATAFDANTIGGERGSYIRDAKAMQTQVRAYRDLQARVKKACFIGTP